MAIALQLCFRRFYYEVIGKPGGLQINWFTSASGLCRWWQYTGWKYSYCKETHRSFARR